MVPVGHLASALKKGSGPLLKIFYRVQVKVSATRKSLAGCFFVNVKGCSLSGSASLDKLEKCVLSQAMKLLKQKKSWSISYKSKAISPIMLSYKWYVLL